MNRAFLALDLYSHFNHQSYGRIRETHFGALRGIMKYDGPNDVPDLDEKTLQRTLHLLFQLFSSNFDTCPETSDEEVEIPLDTHPGVDFRALDFKTKGDVMRDPFGRNVVRKYYKDPEFPTVWKEAVKGGELLKASKLDQGDSRIFLIPGLSFHWLCVKMLQTQHSLFLELAQSLEWPIKIGFPLQHDGFSRMMGSLEGFKYVVEGDCFKWDSSLLPWIWFNFILPLRIKLFKPTDTMSREEFARRLMAVYKDVCYTLIVMPNGQVVVKLRGMPSGFYLTGDDNSLAHLFIKTAMYVYYGKEELLKTDRWYMAADDHLFGTDDPEIADYENRRAFYARFSVTLASDKDLITDSPEQHSFLGFTSHKDPITQKWLPVFNLDKALCSALRPGGTISDSLRYVRLSALRVLCFFHPKYELIKELARYIYSQPFTTEGLKHIDKGEFQELSEETLAIMSSFPSDRQIKSLWHGDERDGSAGGKIVPELITWTLSPLQSTICA